MNKFGKKIKGALDEAANGFEVSGEIKERITEKMKKAETDISREKPAPKLKSRCPRGTG